MTSEIAGAVLWFIQGDFTGAVFKDQIKEIKTKNWSNYEIVWNVKSVSGGFSDKFCSVSPAYWNATRAFMILSGIACFAGVMAGILSFVHFSAFERFSRSFAASILFFISSTSRHTHAHKQFLCALPIDLYLLLHMILTVLNFLISFYLAMFALLAMAIYTGVTLSFLGKRFGDWRFSWSYILGWVAMLMTFFAGERKQCHNLLFRVH